MLIIHHYSSENAFEQLRKQYLKRAPEATLLGTVEEPVEWAALGLSQKVPILSFFQTHYSFAIKGWDSPPTM